MAAKAKPKGKSKYAAKVAARMPVMKKSEMKKKAGGKKPCR